MDIPKDELISVLSQFNPWWRGEKTFNLPSWRRAAFEELFKWITNPPAARAAFLSGARQVGKTTLLLQVIEKLLHDDVAPANILYATFDHPLIKLAGIDAVLQAWRSREPKAHGIEYIFLDEAHFFRDWATWVKHQVDFNKERRIIFTGSAMPLLYKEQESGVGRWHTIKLSTLSFYEYLHLKESNPFLSLYHKFYATNLDELKNLNSKLADIKFDVKSNYQLHSISSDKVLKNIEDKFLNSLIKNSKASLFHNKLPQLKSLNDLFEWPENEFHRVAEIAEPYVGHFHEYLLRGGFPQTAQVEDINQAQKLLREDIIDKVLKRDMTALFGVRRVLELEQTFLYLCLHDGGLLDIQQLCQNLEINRPTAQHFIELLEAAHLIYRLHPFGYGKDVLRAKAKIYLADPAIAPAVLLKGKALLENSTALGILTETAVFKHLFTRYYSLNVRFTYWKGGKSQQEVDLIAEINNQIIPFEVKYRSQHTGSRELKGLQEFCNKKNINRAYVITKSLKDFGPLHLPNIKTKVMRVPAPLLCYWMGEAELLLNNGLSKEID